MAIFYSKKVKKSTSKTYDVPSLSDKIEFEQIKDYHPIKEILLN